MRKPLSGIVAALLMLSPALALAQPASEPATTTARHEVVIPTDFQKITINGRTVLTDSRDAAWLRDALPQLQPATRPSTMPSDLLARLKADREVYIRRATKDLGLPDEKDATEAVDRMIDRLGKLNDLKPPLIYFVTTEPVLHALIKSGWSDPRFYYNRAADRVERGSAIVLTIDRPMDDSLVPSLFDPSLSDAEREKKFLAELPGVEAHIQEQISDQGMSTIYGGFAALAADKVFTPMKLPRDQEWLAMGVTNYLAVRYLADLEGGDFQALFGGISHIPPNWPLQGSSVNLMHPMKEEDLRSDYLTIYNNAMRWKSAAAVDAWVKQSSPDAIAKIMASLQAAKPANSEALVKLIKDQTNVDLTQQLTQ